MKQTKLKKIALFIEKQTLWKNTDCDNNPEQDNYWLLSLRQRPMGIVAQAATIIGLYYS